MSKLYEGVCEFCGQVLQYDEKILSEAKQSDTMAAKLACNCPQAKVFQQRHENLKKGNSKIDELFGEKSKRPVSASMLSYMHQTLKQVVDCNLEKAVIQLDGNVKAQIKRTSRAVTISKETKKKTETEIGM